MEVETAYGYDDVLIKPRNSSVNSRTDVDVTDASIHYPIFASPMPSIVGLNMLMACREANIYGILPKFGSFEERVKTIDYLEDTGYYVSGVAVGIDCPEELRIARYAWDHGAEFICVDVANGHLKRVCDFVKELVRNGTSRIMAGNVATLEGAEALVEAGASFIRVGIGGGNLCTTRNVTGIGVPDLTAISDINQSRYRREFHIVADGGISNSGNAVKAFAAGADYVMLGSYLAKAFEAEHDGEIYGSASRRLHELTGKEIKSIEGMEKKVDKTAPLTELIKEFIMGVSSACTYLDCQSYMDIRYNSKFVTAGKGSIKQL